MLWLVWTFCFKQLEHKRDLISAAISCSPLGLGECWGLGGLLLVQLEISQRNKGVMLERKGMGLQLIMPIKGGFMLADQ